MLHQFISYHLSWLRPLGFIRSKSDSQCVRRKFPGGFVEIGFPFWRWGKSFECSWLLALRVDEVENIYNEFSGVLPEYREGTETLAVKRNHFTDGGDEKIEFDAESFSLKMAQIKNELERHAIPFLDKRYSYEQLASLLKPGGLDFRQNYTSGIHGLICSFLDGQDLDEAHKTYSPYFVTTPSYKKRSLEMCLA